MIEEAPESLAQASHSVQLATAEGARVSGQAAVWVFGKAITSRMEPAPVISITRRSSPNASPRVRSKPPAGP